MSLENAKKFFKDLGQNKELQNNFNKSNLSKFNGKNFDTHEKYLEFLDKYLIPFAKENGYEFTAKEAQNVEQELDDNAVKNVSGGVCEATGAKCATTGIKDGYCAGLGFMTKNSGCHIGGLRLGTGLLVCENGGYGVGTSLHGGVCVTMGTHEKDRK